MEQELINLREEVRYLSGAVTEAAETTKAAAANKAALGRIEALLTDIRDLLAFQQTSGNTHYRSFAVMNAARVEGKQISNRT